MFLHLSVILFTGGGVCIPEMHWGRHPPPGQTISQHALGQTPPSRQTTTAADGTHPTGMHSCCLNLRFPSVWLGPNRLKCRIVIDGATRAEGRKHQTKQSSPLSVNNSKTNAGADPGLPCTVRAHVQREGALPLAGWGGGSIFKGCMVRCNASWMMATWEHPPAPLPHPVDRITDWQTCLETLPSRNFFGWR